MNNATVTLMPTPIRFDSTDMETIQNAFEQIKKIGRNTTRNQLRAFKEEYGYYCGGFTYAMDRAWGGGIIIMCADDTFRNMEHFLGLSNEKGNQELFIRTPLKVLVSYVGGEHVERLVDFLERNE